MKYRQNSFEDYLKKQANSHRIYPSDYLWQSIQEKLHGKSRWPALTVVFFIIVAALTIGTIFIRPDETLLLKINNPVVAKVDNSFSNHLLTQQLTIATIEKVRKHSGEMIAVKVDSKESEIIHEAEKPNNNNRQNNLASVALLADYKTEKNNIKSTLLTMPVLENAGISEIIKNNVQANSDLTEKTAKTQHELIALDKKKLKAPSPWELQFYYTRSSTYRKLIDESKRNDVPMPDKDVNNYVRHKPSIGMEFGLNFKYRLSNSLKLKTGLQFNIREYQIDAFVYGNEPAPLTPDEELAVKTYGRFRSENGSEPVTLTNRYNEISIPLGIDWNKNIDDHFSWGIGATIQPTFVFNKDPLIISTNYKNYAEGSRLLRSFNINTSIETFLSYKIGELRWQIGPQIRYQQLPSYNNEYPIREFLFDYGIKIGVSHSIY